MTSVYTDEDVDVLIKPLLKVKGFTVFTTFEEGMNGKNDIEQLDHTIELKSMLLTHNRVHFEKLFTKLIEEGKDIMALS